MVFLYSNPPMSSVGLEIEADKENQNELDIIFESVLSRRRGVSRRSAVSNLLRKRIAELDTEMIRKPSKNHSKYRIHLDALADELDGCVAHWLDQHLWSLNLAPELVAHDERHVSAVETLLTDLVWPFWLTRSNASNPYRFRPEELIWLSIAAWMHDWGHVGGPIMGADELKELQKGRSPGDGRQDAKFYLSESFDVRYLHGLISQQLLTPTWRGMHHLDPQWALPAGVLCAHHQGFTSLGQEPANLGDREEVKALISEIGGNPERLIPSLWDQFFRLDDAGNDELKDLLKNYSFGRFQVLVALLRVADAADVGWHRASDNGIGRNAFLARCLFRAALMWSDDQAKGDEDKRTDQGKNADSLRLIRTLYVRYAEMVASEKHELGGGEEGNYFDTVLSVVRDSLPSVPVVEKLDKYREFLETQIEHFALHSRVHCVRFVGKQSSETAHWVFDAVVYPSAAEYVDDALKDVSRLIRRELRKGGARKILLDRGFAFGKTRLPHWYRFDGIRARSILDRDDES